MERRNFLGVVGAAFTSLLLPWKKSDSKRFHHEWYTTVTIKGQKLVGYPVQAFRETGYVYAPYVPLQYIRIA